MPDSHERPRQPNQTPPALTRSNQQRFLEEFEEHGFVNEAARAVGISLRNPARWALKGESFAKKYEESKDIAKQVRGNRVLGKIIHAIETGDVSGPVSNLMMFVVKEAFPTFRDNAVTNVNVVGPLNMQFAVDQAVPQAPPSLDHSQAPTDASTRINKRIT